jgi:hypothetical protein
MNARVLKILAATKLLPLLLALPSVMQAQYYYTNSYGIWSYTPNTGPVTITGDTNIPLNGVVVIPNTINGYSVTSIGNSAFYDLTSLTNVTIGTNVTCLSFVILQATEFSSVHVSHTHDEPPCCCVPKPLARIVLDSRKSSHVPPTHNGGCVTSRR